MRSTAKMAESHEAISPMQGLNHFFLIDVIPAIGHLQPDATLFKGDVDEKIFASTRIRTHDLEIFVGELPFALLLNIAPYDNITTDHFDDHKLANPECVHPQCHNHDHL